MLADFPTNSMKAKNLFPLFLLRWSVFCAIFALSQGCQHRIIQEGLETSLVSAEPGTISLLETELVFTLRIANATNKDLMLEGGSHKIYLNGNYLGRGLVNSRLRLPRLASAIQPVSIYLENLRLATQLKELLQGRTFAYKLESILYLADAGQIPSVAEGHLDLAGHSLGELLQRP